MVLNCRYPESYAPVTFRFDRLSMDERFTL